MHAHTNATFSPNLTENENHWLQAICRWGSKAYPVRKLGRKWSFERMYEVGGAPVLDTTKKAATARCELYYRLLLDRSAGRTDPSPGSPAALNASEVM